MHYINITHSVSQKQTSTLSDNCNVINIKVYVYSYMSTNLHLQLHAYIHKYVNKQVNSFIICYYYNMTTINRKYDFNGSGEIKIFIVDLLHFVKH